MPSTEQLIADFKRLLAQGFSVSNARRWVERGTSDARQLERLREALDQLIAEKEVGDAKVL